MCVLERDDLAPVPKDSEAPPSHEGDDALSPTEILLRLTHDPRRIARHKYEPHNTVFLEGDPADHIYEVLSGTLMLYKLLPDGRRQIVEVVLSGDLFGLAHMDVYDCCAEALTPALVAIFDRRDAQMSEAFQQQITKCLLRKVQTLHDHVVTLGRKTALERVATFLIRFIPTRGSYGCTGKQEPKDCTRIHLAMTRQEIADYLGLTLETVSRAFSELKRRGILTLEKQDEVMINHICCLCKLTGAH